ncbi:MAG: nitrile hydratase subunit alpha [Alphaproteobacteria bacterium]|nr:nitrile hydratase subunit alpha [Alphaproteobacteria bacterium]
MADHTHEHDHDHARTFAPDEETKLGYYGLAEIAVRELLIEKGLFAPEEFRMGWERFDTNGPAMGAKVVARAWTDPAFKERLLRDGSAAVREFGVDMGLIHLYAVENTADVHNVIVCTLCSCYPKPLLGPPPDWYKSRDYRSRVVRWPRQVLREFGTAVADDVQVRVHDSTADLRYLVLPERPAATTGWSAAELEGLITRDALIGVARIAPPPTHGATE